MSRKEASNVFNDGLVKDLNPINTPNTVLTDCLNGTLITYDGNEYNLQNEKGNYPLKNCKLKPNYIPVGIKEYGDILYIVSYNPLNERVEIGSYPSPETLHSLNHNALSKDNVVSTLDSYSSGDTVNYSEITENKQPLYIFYGASEYGPEEYKLNPGDLYKITNDLVDLSIYEELKYFIFDDNRRSYDITDKIKEDLTTKQPDENGFYHVNWDIPGWMAIQPKFAEITDFNINVKKIIVPSYGDSKINLVLNFQLSTEDELFIKNLSSAINNLKVRFIITATSRNSQTTSEFSFTEDLKNVVNTKNGSITFHSDDWVSDWNLKASEYSTLKITAIPYVQTSAGSKSNIKVEYDKFEKTLVFNLDQKGNVEDFTIGDGHYWYNVDKEGQKFTLMFDTGGLSSSSVLSQDVYLFYSLKKLNGDTVKDNEEVNYTNILCDRWNIIGETTLSFPLKEFTTSNWNADKNYFYPEEFYIIEFNFYDKDTLPQNPTFINANPIRKFITASELMNNQNVTKYDEVKFDDWIGKYLTSVKDKQIVLSNTSSAEPIINDPFIENEIAFNNWNNNPSAFSRFSSIIDEDTYDESSMKDGFRIVCEANSSISINYKSDISLLYGPMWIDFLNSSYVTFNSGSFNSNRISFSPNTGKLSSDSNTANITGTAKKIIPYQLSPISQDITVWDYKPFPLNYGFYKTCANGDYVLNNHQGTDPTWYGKLNIIIDQILELGIDRFTKETALGIINNNSVSYDEHFLSWYKIEKSTANDVIFISLGIDKVDASNATATGYLGILGSNPTISNTTNSDGPSYLYFAGFKTTNSKVALVRINASSENSARDKFEIWAANINKIICKPETAIMGCFYEAVEGVETLENNMKFSMDGIVYFGSTMKYPYNDNTNLNLFSPSDRDALNGNINNVNVSNLTSNALISFDNINLDKKEDIISTSVDFSSKDAAIATLKTNIESVNTKSQTQLVNSDDSVFHSENIDKFSETYIELTPTANGNKFLNLLNDQIFENKEILYYRLTHNSGGHELEMKKNVAFTSSSYSIGSN